uniref:SHSP domain-containing protein n=1 Tax=Globodera rostochiensis TaxID=31243 RepID=A0A914HQR2_GLORO
MEIFFPHLLWTSILDSCLVALIIWLCNFKRVARCCYNHDLCYRQKRKDCDNSFCTCLHEFHGCFKTKIFAAANPNFWVFPMATLNVPERTTQWEPKAINDPIKSQPKIKIEPYEEQFDGRWRDESALKGIVKVEHEPHYGAVKMEGTVKIKHEFGWGDEENGTFKKQLEDHVKEEDQDEQALNISDEKNLEMMMIIGRKTKTIQRH